MIVTRLKGGLGNQMFQYAAACGLAHKHKAPVLIDRSWFDTGKDVDAPRHYELDCFALKQDFMEPDQFVTVNEIENSVRIRLYNATRGRYKPRLLVYTERAFSFDRAVLNLPDNVLLEGYWQTEKYFKHIRKDILRDFKFTLSISSKTSEILKQIKSTPSISLHVRRGDYISSSAASKLHGLMDVEYYQQAVQRIAKQVLTPHLYIFSDEPAWCQKNLKFPHKTTYVAHNTTGSEDMYLMTQCQHHIIANSTFSWWGAWLNPNDKKIVYAPRVWFIDRKMGTGDILPKEWNRL